MFAFSGMKGPCALVLPATSFTSIAPVVDKNSYIHIIILDHVYRQSYYSNL